MQRHEEDTGSRVDCWDADGVRITAEITVGFAPGFQQDDFRTPLDSSKAEAGSIGMGICPWESCIYRQNCADAVAAIPKQKGERKFHCDRAS